MVTIGTVLIVFGLFGLLGAATGSFISAVFGLVCLFIGATMILSLLDTRRYIEIPTGKILDPEDIPEYDGTKILYINKNKSEFEEDEIEELILKLGANQHMFSPPLKYARPSTATALVSPYTYNTSTRKGLSGKPTGFVNKKLVDGSWLYHRCHLIAFTFLNENIDIHENLITGTTEFNVNRSWGMLHIEDTVRDYLHPNGKYFSRKNEILYQVTPVFRGDDLVARGVHIRAKSVKGNNLDLNVFIYNVQDGVQIDYRSGKSTVEMLSA